MNMDYLPLPVASPQHYRFGRIAIDDLALVSAFCFPLARYPCNIVNHLCRTSRNALLHALQEGDIRFQMMGRIFCFARFGGPALINQHVIC